MRTSSIMHLTNEREHARQKVRRAQGLQRHLLRQKNIGSTESMANLQLRYSQEAAMHLLSPLLLVGAFVAMLARWATIGFAEIDFSNATFTTMHLGLFTIEATVFASWLSVRYGVRIPLLNQLGAVIDGNVQLVRALWKSTRGRRSICGIHIWMEGMENKKKGPHAPGRMRADSHPKSICVVTTPVFYLMNLKQRW